MSSVTWIGTSGFSYQDWVGAVYPESTPKSRWFEFYCTMFTALEWNMTYYQIPSSQVVQSFARRAPRPFLLSIKAHRSITHQGKLDLLAPLQDLYHCAQQNGLTPQLLFQFPFSFQNDADARGYLGKMVEQVPARCSFEFRHASWAVPEVLGWLQQRGFSMVSVDQPPLPHLMPRILFRCEPIYLRFHGRNAQKWWTHEQAHERYDYQYSSAELLPWVKRLIEARAQERIVFFNNHFRGKAAKNAKQFSLLLEEKASRQS
ncbi:MAG TPA: DUF72 domain-containing protein [Thermotogota bacterium]|nr:DUF72 domain-containing protein [Thermotogota bacterium]HRW91941.1 DUF72 domain-containing protein [Thermotogota bacterium]